MSRANESRVLQHPGSTREAAMIESKISISDNNRRKLVELLNARLADTNRHANAVEVHALECQGRGFLPAPFAVRHNRGAHGRCRRSYRETDYRPGRPGKGHDITSRVRLTPERVRPRHRNRHGSCPYPPGSHCGRGECIGGAINESDELEDRATSDLFTEIVRTADKDLYFLESHLHG